MCLCKKQKSNASDIIVFIVAFMMRREMGRKERYTPISHNIKNIGIFIISYRKAKA